jgi:hypothetical protein
VHPAQLGRLRRYREARIEKPKIMAVPRPAHQAVRTQDDRLPVAVLCAVPDAEDAQCDLEWGVAATEYIADESHGVGCEFRSAHSAPGPDWQNLL